MWIQKGSEKIMKDWVFSYSNLGISSENIIDSRYQWYRIIRGYCCSSLVYYDAILYAMIMIMVALLCTTTM